MAKLQTLDSLLWLRCSCWAWLLPQWKPLGGSSAILFLGNFKSLQLWGTYSDVALDNWGVTGKASALRAWRYVWSLGESCYCTVNSYLFTKCWVSFCHWWGMDKAPETDWEPLLEHMTWMCEETPVKWPHNNCAPNLPIIRHEQAVQEGLLFSSFCKWGK